MKKNTVLKILVCLLVVLVASITLVACNNRQIDDYDYLVTYDYNEGNLVADKFDTQQIGVMKNSYASIRPGYSDKFVERAIEGYFIEGWYLPLLDENNQIQKDENGFVMLGTKWNFESDRVTKDITLYANFAKKVTLHYIDIADDSEVGSLEGKPGDVRPKPTSSSLTPSREGYTFLENYYVNKACTELFCWSDGRAYTFGENDANVYVKFLEGEWALIHSASELNSAILNNKNAYLMNDIDYATKSGTYNPWGSRYLGGGDYAYIPGEYNGILDGQGHKVSNLTRRIFVTKDRGNENVGLFGVLGENCYIHDITFEDCVLIFENTFEEGLDRKIAMFAYSAKDGAKVENVTVKGTVVNKSKEGYVLEVLPWIANNSSGDKADNNTCNYSEVVVDEQRQ